MGIAKERCMEIVYDTKECERFLRRDRRLRLVNINGPNQLHKDERIALFLELAGLDDYVFPEAMLRTRGRDLGVVIDAWMREGLPIVPYDGKLLLKVTFAAPWLPDLETNSMWPPSRSSVPILSGINQADRDDYYLNYGQGRYINRKRWIINYDAVHPLIGLIQPEKMLIDMIRCGEFKVLRSYQKPTAKGTKRKGQEHRRGHYKAAGEDFDRGRLHSISKLVSWRRQPPCRFSGELKRNKAKEYHDLADEWIFDWHAAERDRILDGKSVDDFRARCCR